MDKTKVPTIKRTLSKSFIAFILFSSGVLWQRYYGVHQLMLELGIRTIEYSHTNDREPISKSALTLPLVILIAGQSNVANTVSTLSSTRLPIYNFYNNKLYRAKDPLLGATGNGGSIWLELSSQLLTTLTQQEIVIINVSRNHSSIADWAGEGKYHQLIGNTFRSAAEYGLTPQLILWGQGERDAIDNMSRHQYQSLLENFIRDTKENSNNIPMLISLSSRCFNIAPHENIRQAQQASIIQFDHVHFGPDTDKLDAQYRYDGCHFNNNGRIHVAQAWSEKIQQVLINGIN